MPETPTPDNAALAAPTAPTATAVKPGWKTSEFWLAFVASMLGAAYASGLISDGGTAAKIAGFAAMALTSIGYSVSRGAAKK